MNSTSTLQIWSVCLVPMTMLWILFGWIKPTRLARDIIASPPRLRHLSGPKALAILWNLTAVNLPFWACAAGVDHGSIPPGIPGDEGLMSFVMMIALPLAAALAALRLNPFQPGRWVLFGLRRLTTGDHALAIFAATWMVLIVALEWRRVELTLDALI